MGTDKITTPSLTLYDNEININRDALVKLGVNVHLFCENHYMAMGLKTLLPELDIYHACLGHSLLHKSSESFDMVVIAEEKNADFLSQFQTLLSLRKQYPFLPIILLTNNCNPLFYSIFSGVLQTESFTSVREIASSQLRNSGYPMQSFPFLPMLTVRQRWVLGLLARGVSTIQAAIRLGISPKTIGSHCVYVRNRLGLSDRLSWLKFCMLAAYIPLPDEGEHV